MLLLSKNSDVGIGASSSENKSSRSNSSEPISLSVLLNTTSVSTVLIAPVFIPFMDGDHIPTYFIIETLT